MFDIFKKNKKEKEAQAAREAEREAERQRKEEKREQRAKIDEHARGGEKIRRALQNVDLESYVTLAEQKENKLSVETLERYIAVVDNIERVLDDAQISDVDTVEIDNNLVQLVALFGIAVNSGNENTATQLLKGIAEGVKFTRTPFFYSNEEQKEEIARKRRKDTNTLLLLGRCQEYVDRIEDSIAKLEEYGKELEESKTKASKVAKDMLSENPLLKNELIKTKAEKKDTKPEILRFKNAVRAANDSHNKLEAAKLLEAKKEENLRVIRTTIREINLTAFGTPEMFGNVAMEQLRNLHEEFIEDVKAAKREQSSLEEINSSFDATIKTMFEDEISDKDIQILYEYSAREQEEKEEKEKIKAAKEKLRKEEKEREHQEEIHKEKYSENHHNMIIQ